jgi:hypothetical protein
MMKSILVVVGFLASVVLANRYNHRMYFIAELHQSAKWAKTCFSKSQNYSGKQIYCIIGGRIMQMICCKNLASVNNFLPLAWKPVSIVEDINHYRQGDTSEPKCPQTNETFIAFRIES